MIVCTGHDIVLTHDDVLLASANFLSSALEDTGNINTAVQNLADHPR